MPNLNSLIDNLIPCFIGFESEFGSLPLQSVKKTLYLIVNLNIPIEITTKYELNSRFYHKPQRKP